MTPTEILERKADLRNAEASLKIEGLILDQEAKSIMNRLVVGEITREEAKKALIQAGLDQKVA